MTRARDLAALLGFVLLCHGTGTLGGLVTRDAIASGWYAGLPRSPLTPPPLAFAVVWPTLFLLMAVAAWLVWRRGTGTPGVRPALLLFLAHLAVNFAWSAVFFGLRSPPGALAVVLVLVAMIAALVVLFARQSRTAGLLLVPYLLWGGFATYLNGYVVLAAP